ncbi:hypothetical protein F5Y16DRAFT_38400 [Xylariaceae sp. FL0255]|nr:hypothetical protein F5Y16DRAFT_38400 [Xylariaceae sp. FL0255]
MEDLELAKKSISQDEPTVVFLQVVDAKFENGTERQCYPGFSSNVDIDEKMRSLPRHQSGWARILDVTIHSNFVITGFRDTRGPKSTQAARESLMRFLQREYTPRFDSRRIFRWHNDPLLVNDIGSISSQWSQSWEKGTTQFYRLVNRSSLQQDKLDFDLHPRDSYLICAQDEKNRLIVIIVHDVWSTQKFCMNTATEGEPFENPRSISKIGKGSSWTSLSDGTLKTFAQLLVLDFFVASIYLQPVDYYEKLIYPHPQMSQEKAKEILNLSLIKNPHLQLPLGLFEPRLSARSKEAFKEIEDAEGILRSVNNLVSSIGYVIEKIRENKGKKFGKERLKELEKICEERRLNAKQALEALGRQLDYLSKRHAIREAKSIKTLTILASIYLPLSLSASLLGMSSPFKQLAHDRVLNEDDVDNTRLVGTNLLFDFFGVFIILATGTVFVVYCIKAAMYLHRKGMNMRPMNLLPKHLRGPFSIGDYGQRWRFGGIGGRIFECLGYITIWFVGAGIGIELLAIFLQGMLNGAQSAWTYAQWGFITYCATGGLLISLYLLVYLILYQMRLGVGWWQALRRSVSKPIH